MATIRVKRRLSGGSGAPASLKTAELAWSGVDQVLFIGQGDDGGGNATSILSIAGAGAAVLLSGDQTITDTKTFGDYPIIPTAPTSDNTTKAASTAFVKAQNYLTGNETVTFTGDATGSGETSVALTLANSGVTAGTYGKVTVDAKGRVTVGAALDAGDIPSLAHTKISDFDTGVRSNRLDQMADPTAAVSMNSQKITNLGTPTGAADAVTKAYADALTGGLDFKESVRVATTGNHSLSGLSAIDGITPLSGERVLVKDQTSAEDNGIYEAASGAWSRASDFDTSGDVSSGALTFVEEGSTNGGQQWILTTTGNITLGTTSLSFTQFGGGTTYGAGNGLTLTGSTFSVDTVSSGRITVAGAGIDLATVGSAGTYRSVTTDAYGRVTAGTNPTTLAGYGITDAQALDATLTAFAGLSGAADRLPYFTGSDAFALATFTSQARSLMDDTSFGAMRTTLGLGTIATQAASNVNLTGGTIGASVVINSDIDGGTY